MHKSTTVKDENQKTKGREVKSLNWQHHPLAGKKTLIHVVGSSKHNNNVTNQNKWPFQIPKHTHTIFKAMTLSSSSLPFLSTTSNHILLSAVLQFLFSYQNFDALHHMAAWFPCIFKTLSLMGYILHLEPELELVE